MLLPFALCFMFYVSITILIEICVYCIAYVINILKLICFYILDKEIPRIQCPKNIVIHSDFPTKVFWSEGAFTDNVKVKSVSFNPKNGTSFDSNKYHKVVMTVEDMRGNTDSCVIEVYVKGMFLDISLKLSKCLLKAKSWYNYEVIYWNSLYSVWNKNKLLVREFFLKSWLVILPLRLDYPRNFEMWVRDFLGTIRFGFTVFEKWFANHELRALISELVLCWRKHCDNSLMWQLVDVITHWCDSSLMWQLVDVTTHGCDNSLMWQLVDVTTRGCDNSLMWQLVDVTTRWCDNSLMWQLVDVTTRWCDNSWMWQLVDVTTHGCDNSLMWQLVDVTICWCDNSLMWQFVDVTTRGCDNSLMWQLVDVTTRGCDNSLMWQLVDVTTRGCDNLLMWQLIDVTICWCNNSWMWQLVDVTTRGCDNSLMWQFVDVTTRRCDNSLMWQLIDVTTRGCDNSLMWQFVDVTIRGCDSSLCLRMWKTWAEFEILIYILLISSYFHVHCEYVIISMSCW